MTVNIALIFILTIVNGVFAMSEIAFVSLNDNKVKVKAQEGDKKSLMVYNLLQDSNRFLSTIQIAITLAGFLNSAIASDAFSGVIGEWIVKFIPSLTVATVKPFSMVLVTLVLSYISLVFGELVPKRIGMNNPERVAYSLVGLVNFISKVTKPVVVLLSMSTNLVVKLLRIDTEGAQEKVTEEEIRMMLDVSQENGAILESEKRLIDNIFEFDNTPVSDIMTHRTDMLAIDIEDNLENIIEIIFSEKYTRIPVYQESIDNIIGILHLKDFLKIDYKNNLNKDSLMSILRKPYYIPDGVECDELFFDLQKKKVHIAIIIDEYGGTAGLVTIEDLIEEIVGNIFDEYDEEENDEIIKLKDHCYNIAGFVSLDNVENLIYIDLPLDDFDTLSGFVIGELGRLPVASDVNKAFEFNGYLFTIVTVEDKVIGRVRVEKIEEENKAQE